MISKSEGRRRERIITTTSDIIVTGSKRAKRNEIYAVITNKLNYKIIFNPFKKR